MEEKVFEFLDDILQNSRKVLIEGDYDTDGIMCAVTINDYLTALGSRKHDVYQYRARTHRVDRYAMQQAIQGRYDYMIIGDTGSADMDIIERLCQLGIRVIILDHHNSIYSYDDFPDNAAVINTTMENLLLKEDIFKLSAGALCYCVMAKYALERHNIALRGAVSYALTSLYADSMDMSNKLNRGIYWASSKLSRNELPVLLQHFMNEYTVFGRRYIDFWYAPRINALFRAEKLSLLNYYFFHKDILSVNRIHCIELIENIYTAGRNMVNMVVDLVKVEELSNFVFCDLSCVDDEIPVEKNKLYNYTGLIANKLSNKYGKTAVVLCETARNYKGSLRDKYNRNYLSIFQQFCEAGGHNSAFGFTINSLDYQRFVSSLMRVDKYYSEGTYLNGPIIEEHEVPIPDSQLLEDMALYNDFVGGDLPAAYIKKQFIGNMPERYNTYNHVYSWGGYSIQSTYALDFGAQLILKPIKRKKVTLML